VAFLAIQYTLIKKKIKFSSYTVQYKEIQSGAVATSYMRQGFLIFEDDFPIQYMTRPLVIYDFATAEF
jgi:hypothetical protein